MPKFSCGTSLHVNHCAWSKGSLGGAPLWLGNEAVDVEVNSDGPVGMLALPSLVKDFPAGNTF